MSSGCDGAGRAGANAAKLELVARGESCGQLCGAGGAGAGATSLVPGRLSPVCLFQMYLRELLRLMHPRFYQHLSCLGEDGLQMLFCHRWILLCFKREFPEAEALRMWEACWAHYQVGEGAMGGARPVPTPPSQRVLQNSHKGSQEQSVQNK